LYVNSYYLLGGTVASALFGFLFWALAARTTTAAEIGIATAAISSASLLISLCDLGLGTAVVYFAANRKEQATALVNAAISAGWVLSSLAAVIFLLGSPLWASGLLPLRNDFVLAVTFVAFTALSYLLTLQDAAMLSRRQAQFVFWRNLACNVPPVLLLMPLLYLVGTHRTPLLAFTLPNIVVAVLAGLLVLPRFFAEYRFFGRFDRSLLSSVASYSLATYGANLLWASTTYALPIIAINTLSAASTGYFYISWTLVNFTLVIPRAVVSSLFVEGAHMRTQMRRAAVQSLLLILALALPLMGLLWFGGHWLLGIFGEGYVNMPLLRLLLLSVFPFSINSIYIMYLRVKERLVQVVLFSGMVAAGIVGLSNLLAPRIGVQGLAWGWLLGHGIPMIFVLLIMARSAISKNFKFLTRSLAGLLLIALLFVFQIANAYASEGSDCQYVKEEDLNGDGNTDKLTLRCSLLGQSNDLVYVFDRDGDFSRGREWREAADFETDLWLFDVGGDEDIQLAIDFQREGRSLVAKLYDDQSGDGKVAYKLDENQITLTESVHPTVRVVAPNGWWTEGTLINFNLELYVDGLVDAAFGVRNKLAGIFKTDGIVDITIDVRDSDDDGRPDYDWRTLSFQEPLPPVAATTPRTYLMVNARDDESPLIPLLAWPYLGGETYGYVTSSPIQFNQPPIQIDWEKGQITAVGEFVTSRGNDGQWFVYSFNPVEPDQLNTPNFESPFAWYDLADDHDRQPELALRFGYYAAGDPLVLGGRLGHALNIVRYSWDQNNDGFWDYKVDLLGQHTVTSTVSLSEFDLTLLPYTEAPDWVTDRSWGPILFVAAEVPAIGEGIYVWDTPPWLTEGYFAGRSDEPRPSNPDDYGFNTIQAGFRGEYRFVPQDRPTLYLSTIDHQLHLLKAEGGIWNIDETSEVRYANLNNDQYLDQWTYTMISASAETVTTTRQLNIAGNHLLYTDGEEVIIRQAPIDPSLFETLPPASHEEWKALGEQLEATASEVEPGDFKAMMVPFEGPELAIKGAHLRDYRPVGKTGFRFVLDLQPDFEVQGDKLFEVGTLPSETSQLTSGRYLVTYNRQFTVEPLTEPELSLTVQLPTDESLLTLQDVQPIRVLAQNSGLADARNLTLVGEIDNGQAITQLGQQSLDLLSGEPIYTTFDWQPKASQKWLLRFWLEDAAGKMVTQIEHSVSIPLEEAGSRRSILTLSTSGGKGALSISAILVFTGLMGLAVSLVGRRWNKVGGLS